MIIRRISIEGYGIIGRRLELSFPETGRIGIFGPNESGKSTLLESIQFALYGLRGGPGGAEKREDVITWGKEQAKVSLEFSSGDSRYLIERSISRGGEHLVKLARIINEDGEVDERRRITNETEVQEKIEEITGMDRDSFTKLVFVRQNDLDALQNLSRSSRKALVNKVMGIEVFDSAILRVKQEKRLELDKFRGASEKFNRLKQRKEEYEEKSTKNELEQKALEELQKKLSDVQAKQRDALKSLGKFDWLLEFKTKNDKLESTKWELSRVREDLRSLERLEQDHTRYSKAIQEYEGEIKRLQDLKVTYGGLTVKIEEARKTIDEHEARIKERMKSLKMSSNDWKLLSEHLPKKRRNTLLRAAVAIIAAGSSLVVSFNNLILAVLFAACFGLVAVYFFLRFLKLDKLLASAGDLSALSEQLLASQKSFSDLKEEYANLAGVEEFDSSGSIDDALARALTKFREETGQTTIDGLKAVAERVRDEKSKLEEKNLHHQEKESLERERELDRELEELMKVRPSATVDLQYDARVHEELMENYKKVEEEHNTISKSFAESNARVQLLETDLRDLKGDYDASPEVESQFEEARRKIDVLEILETELAETSQELRSKVIPYARLIINQILPKVTAGRYYDFDITKDLKFRAHSTDAGGYKEREIFSGGTQDQFLLALRLAFTQSILDSKLKTERYSLFMDESTASSDESRKQGIFEVLEAMRNFFPQIFVIAHEDISNLVDNHITLGRDAKGYTVVKSKSW